MRESSIEFRLKREVEKVGGKCFKFVSPGVSGVPDRICLFPGGKIVFVELKAPRGRVSKLQGRIINMIRSLGFRVEVINSIEGIEELIRSAKN